MSLSARICFRNSRRICSLRPLHRWMRGARRCSNSVTTRGRGSTFSLRSHKCGELSRDHVGQSVTLYGWIRKPRVLGSQGVAFLPVYDTTGVTQFSCNAEEWQGSLDTLKSHETVVKAMGVVRERPAEAVNTNTPTGEIEVELEALEVLNEATNLPFATFGRGEESVTVEQQLRERQLYLRLPHMQRNIRLRSKVAMALREALVDRHDFVEIETPTLFKRTPEGAQEFIVPTKTRGKFFSLAQSPQQFKQLLMVSGFDRYFQFARCYRDEDQRSDRQPEFTQVDLEMSFVDSECVMGLTEELLHSTISSLCPELSLPCRPFPRMEYRQAMEQYGSDKPDTRYEMKLQDLGSIWRELIKEMGMDDAEKSPFSAHMYGLRVPKWEQALRDIDSSSRKKGVYRQIEGTSSKYPVAMLQMDQSSSSGNSLETLLGSHFPPALLNVFSKSAPPLSERFGERVKQHLGWEEGDLCVLATSKEAGKDEMLAALGAWRTLAAQVLSQTGRLELSPQQLNFLWVSDFPLFSVSEKRGKRGLHSIESTHHPFTAPVPEHEHMLQGNPSLELLPQVSGQHYDVVVNGVELGGGSIRIHNPTLQEHILTNILKVPTDQFSHLLKGLKSGCPPHGGIALGFDRLMAVLCQATSLKDVVAFPKSFYGRCLLTGAPSDLRPSDLTRYHFQQGLDWKP